MPSNPLDRFHYYPRLNPNPNSPLPVCVEPSPSPSPSISPSPSPSVSPSPSPSPVNRAFSVSCPIVPEWGYPKTDLVLTDIEDIGIINAELNSWFYLNGPAYSGCAQIGSLNPDISESGVYATSPYLIGIYIDFGSYTYIPYPSGEAPCVSDYPCPS